MDKMNLTKSELVKGIIEPYLKGIKFEVYNKVVDPSEVAGFEIYETDDTRDDFEDAVEFGDDVAEEFLGVSINKTRRTQKSVAVGSKNVFIVHGRDDKPKLELARMLAKLGFDAIILSEQPDKGRTIIEKLEQETLDIGFAFVILTPDDIGFQDLIQELSKQYPIVSEFLKNRPLITSVLRPRARQNVILELGYFVGKIGRDRVCCLYKGDVELPSDIHGVLFKKFEKSVEECYKGILEELKAAGYEIKL